ncbi:MAG: hypothetical protein A2826_01015 [Candidatus Doudnabacteria bacterium RIFCSPHIGHO2_01_FULL_43_23]|uniref:Bacterial type II secretion system protein E domain-containing protein n=1 Tax=Candidatus Doudnabacteria bacterium RIFCSPHIGHO2_01_FULL_43_23 TaxID=1817822 RepID=A0A1F5NQT1_9BACT|nr:MAG: hypothetical protein A2826_01015 [Candidatus Doudnabacteria bacterium RIFCSPHIGHO2_01_FULL_43_23]
MTKTETSKVKQELSLGTGISIVNLIDHLVEEAFEKRASDIHLDPREKDVRVRFRVDGVMVDFHEFPQTIRNEVITRIKILAGLRTDEHQTAQDGRFRIKLEKGVMVDVRVSIVPTYYGENAMLRLLSDGAQNFTLDSLGFSEPDQKKILKAIHHPYGMVLSTGPTGSGKTTTLYTLLKILNTSEVAIVTIEDPIEYAISGIQQLQVNPRTGLTFSDGLRSILRQDPNVIMVGEIRDKDTAGIATNTALTGHLLLSTLHTNDSATTLPRLIDMGIEAYLIASTVNIAIGQRLVRKICDHCKVEKRMNLAARKSLQNVIPPRLYASSEIFYEGKGCDKCLNTGYKGRIGIYEVMEVTNVIRDAILRRATAVELRKLATERGMTTMVEDGFMKAQRGLTTIDEVLRMLHE